LLTTGATSTTGGSGVWVVCIHRRSEVDSVAAAGLGGLINLSRRTWRRRARRERMERLQLGLLVPWVFQPHPVLEDLLATHSAAVPLTTSISNPLPAVAVGTAAADAAGAVALSTAPLSLFPAHPAASASSAALFPPLAAASGASSSELIPSAALSSGAGAAAVAPSVDWAAAAPGRGRRTGTRVLAHAPDRSHFAALRRIYYERPRTRIPFYTPRPFRA